jgi:two-component system sensor histidine kinase VanS
MKNKDKRMFFKIFTYTMVLVLLICLTAVFLFARQFISFYRKEQFRQLSASFQPMMTAITVTDGTPEELAEIARTFSDNNQSFRFKIQEVNGSVIFSTYDVETDTSVDSSVDLKVSYTTNEYYVADLSGQIPGRQLTRGRVRRDPAPGNPVLENPNENAGNGIVLIGYGSQIDYGDLFFRSSLGLLIMCAIAVFGAFIFARKITKPLEDEIIRERTIEENQRLFFSAASHELKTPIAAARALVESMIAGVGDYKDHSKYLRECMKTLDAQGLLVSEILEIVKLSDSEAEVEPEAVDLPKLGEEVLAEHRPFAEQRGLSIDGDFPPVQVRANRNLLHRVLSNVIANAVQNTPKGGIIRIESAEGKNLRLSITNTGTRIPDEVV